MQNNLRSLRESHGWTLNDMAEKTGYNFRTIAGYETNVRPSRDFIRKAAEVFKVDESEILSDDSDKFRETTTPYAAQFRIELLTDEDLEQTFQRLAEERKSADKDHQVKILQTLRAITVEFERRISSPPTDQDLMRKDHESTLRDKASSGKSPQEQLAETWEGATRKKPPGSNR